MARTKQWTTLPGLWPKLRTRARAMRHDPTSAESALWARLRGGQLNGWTFRRQHPIGSRVVDFFCVKAQLVIEVDGGIHDRQQAQDAAREQDLRERGVRIVRFRNEEVLTQIEDVLRRIALELELRKVNE